MAKLDRIVAKIFGETADPTGADPQIGQFGSASLGTYVGTGDVATIQSLPAWSNGWIDAVTPTQQFPTLPEMTGVHKVLSYHEAYLLQSGIPEWDSATTYYQDDFCRVGHTVYYSLQDENINHNPTTDTMYWKDFAIGANRELSNLEDAGEDRLHALKGYLESGKSYTDTTLYNDVFHYNHSTFDLSKFTVVGTLTITNNGIASGFTNSTNYIQAYSLNAMPSMLVIKAKARTENTLTAANRTAVCGKNSEDSNVRFYVRGDGSNASRLVIGYKKSDATYFNTFINVSANTEYDINITINGSNISISINGTEIVNGNNLYTANNIESIGVGSVNGNNCWLGSIDLKQLSITVDGYPVFNGNKTGIDTIKSDNYTVVGSPTISADGIASGFNSSNYIQYSTANILSGKSWNILQRVYWDGATTTVYLKTADNNSYLRINATGTMTFNAYDTNNTQIWVHSATKIFYSAGWYYIGIKYDYSTGTFTTIYGTTLNTMTDYATATKGANVQLRNLDNSHYINIDSNCTIDLNSFKVYANGDLVYQPCLLIPYTESSTGSKIVDAFYRDRVIDAFEQYGSANYYTIDETNQNATLPMGEVYGFIEGKASTDFDNVTQTAIDKALDWIMPDWSRAVNKNPYETYTATQRGWINAQGYTNQDEIGVKINSNVVAYTQAPGGTGDDSGFACLVPVNVGDQYETYIVGTASTNERIDFVKFIPCKGDI